MILQIAELGEVLGLGGTISGKPYELTAETIDPCQVNFVKREAFLHFLKNQNHSNADGTPSDENDGSQVRDSCEERSIV